MGINKKKIIGFKKQKKNNYTNITKNDKILFYGNFNNRLSFVAYTMVNNLTEDQEKLYNKYLASRKINLKGVKYFTKPLVIKDIAEELLFIKDVNKPSQYFKSEYREIEEQDFWKIIHKISLTKEFPAYLEKDFNISMDDFIMDSTRALYNILKISSNHKQFEISKFLYLLRKMLKEYNISKSPDEIQEFYAKNVWKLGLKHNPSRDPSKFVSLYTPSGKKRDFSYISLE